MLVLSQDTSEPSSDGSVYGVVGQVIDGGVHGVVDVATDVVVVPGATVVPVTTVVEVGFVGAGEGDVELNDARDPSVESFASSAFGTDGASSEPQPATIVATAMTASVALSVRGTAVPSIDPTP
jgi:hypothetical protein